MHSRSATCVLGDARFTSSTSSRLANTGPGLNSNRFERWSKTFTPVTSDGRRSGVNWSREKEQSIERANAFASIVFPTPGKSSMIRSPSATRQRAARRSVSSGARTTWARLSTIRWIDSAAAASTRSLSTASSSAPLQPLGDVVEDRRRDPLLGRLLDPPLALGRDEHDLVLDRVEADVVASHVVEDDQVGPLVAELLPRALETVLAAVGGEANEQLTVRAPGAELTQDDCLRLERHRPGLVVLRPLALLGIGRPVVGDRGRHHDHVRVAEGERLAGDVLGGWRFDHR